MAGTPTNTTDASDDLRVPDVIFNASQKAILIGTGGKMIKRLATDARKDLEDFLKEKVFLELRIKVDKDWRNDERKLKQYGYFDG